MESERDRQDIDMFLSSHEPVVFPTAIAPGETIGDWRVTAFLGRGGSGEVYRVVHVTLGSAAAIKICVKNAEKAPSRDETVCARFRREAEILAKNTHPAFPRFLGFGERNGRPWYAMELLEFKPLPSDERRIAQFLLAVAAGLQHLHSRGFIHRDVKPGNILWRDSSPVLIDLGLIKNASEVRGHAGESLSIVDGRAVRLGTPRYAAPEQMSGEEVSPATDVYALGMLADDCFGRKPPPKWRRIIQRATAAVPQYRYSTADEFADAIRRRNHRRNILILAIAAAAVIVSAIAMVSYCRKRAADEEARRSMEHDEIQEMLQRDVY